MLKFYLFEFGVNTDVVMNSDCPHTIKQALDASYKEGTAWEFFLPLVLTLNDYITMKSKSRRWSKPLIQHNILAVFGHYAKLLLQYHIYSEREYIGMVTRN